MRSTITLFANACRITLFTRPNCSLCDTAKVVLQKVQSRRPFDFTQIDVMESGQQRWQDQYAFDTPVIHVEKATQSANNNGHVLATQKLMHRFSEQQVEKLMDTAEQK